MAKSAKSIEEIMTAPLLTKFNAVRDSLEKMRKGLIEDYWELGQLLKVVQDDQDRYRQADGTSGIDMLLAATGKHLSTLKLALRFADQYTKAELDEALALSNSKNDFKLAWSHMVILLTLPTKAERKKYAKIAVKGGDENLGMSAKELHAFMKAEGTAAGKSNGGRPFVLPPTIFKQMAAMHKDIVALQKKQNQVWNGDVENGHSLFMQVSGLTEADLDTDWLESLVDIRNGFGDLITMFTKNVEDCDACVQRLQGIRDARELAATREAAALATAVAAPSRAARHIEMDEEAPAAPVIRRGRAAAAAAS